MKVKFPAASARFNVPIYGGAVYLFRTAKKLNQARAYLKLAAISGAVDGQCLSLESSDGTVCYFVGWYSDKLSVLVHEAGHLAMYIMERAGIDVRNDVGEAYCYLIEELVTQLGVNRKQRAKSAR